MQFITDPGFEFFTGPQAIGSIGSYVAGFLVYL